MNLIDVIFRFLLALETLVLGQTILAAVLALLYLRWKRQT